MIEVERENVRNEPPKGQFDSLLHTISDNVLVTEESRKRRDQFRHHMRDTLVPQLNAHGAKDVICVLAGSVAVGMATEESDTDVQIFYSSKDPLNPHKLIDDSPDVIKTAQEREAGNRGQGMGFDRIEDLLDEERFRVNGKAVLENRLEGGSPFEDISVLFYPSLNEFSDPQEKTTIDSWRKKVLENLVTLYPPQQAELLWNHIRDTTGVPMLHYEHLENDKKRKARVKNVINMRIKEKFPRDRAMQDRAKGYIEAKRAKNMYPDLSQMLEEFGVEPSRKPYLKGDNLALFQESGIAGRIEALLAEGYDDPENLKFLIIDRPQTRYRDKPQLTIAVKHIEKGLDGQEKDKPMIAFDVKEGEPFGSIGDDPLTPEQIAAIQQILTNQKIRQKTK